MPDSQNSNWSMEPGLAVGPQLFQILRERIIRNDFTPGMRLSESEIAAAFSVSRQPVREAFIKLAESGLLEIRPQRGSFVSKISISGVMDARFVREAIEADIVKLVTATPDAALLAELRKQLAEQHKVTAKDHLAFMELDELFHRTLAKAAGKAYAWNVIESTRTQMDRVRHLSLVQFPMEKIVQQHTVIVDAIASGDVALAESAIRAHLHEIVRDLPDIAGEKPEFFAQA